LVVGQNNVGKTAMLEAFRLGGGENRPYRGAMMARHAAPFPISRFDVKLTISGPELNAIALRQTGVLPWVAIPPDAKTNPQRFINTLLSAPAIELDLSTAPGEPTRSIRAPSHGLFEKTGTSLAARVAVSENRDRILLTGAACAGDQDDLLPYLFDRGREILIYVFRAERLSIGSHPIQDTDVLAPNGANLPVVLLKMQGNPVRWERFNEHVRTIFPALKRVVVGPVGQTLTVFLWSVDLTTERDDLAIRLEESGTGVAQVLAILYVAMSRERTVIVIDEPNSFLHPGASKKLMRILKQYANNQYVISTHSAEVIETVDPDVIHLVRWDGVESKVTQLARPALSDMKRALTDAGVELADVFGADKVIWVESPTEEKCFPLIASALLGGVPLGWFFATLRDSGDLESKGFSVEAIWAIYKRLCGAPGLLPPTAAFSFGRDHKSDQTIERLRRLSGGMAHFLPRATFENYLIDPSALHAVIKDEYARLEMNGAPSTASIAEWINSMGVHYGPVGAGQRPLSDCQWLNHCDAPKLLASLFLELSDHRLVYRGLSHSIALTEWLLSNAPGKLEELGRYLAELIEGAGEPARQPQIGKRSPRAHSPADL
jgi:hypothetical protein